MRVSINELSKWTRKDRATVRKRLQELTAEPGPYGAQTYDSKEALEAIYLGGGGDYQSAAQEKARLDHHRANIEEMKAAKMRAELAPMADVVKAGASMIAEAKAKLLALPSRVAQSLPVEPEVRRQAQESIQTEVFAALDELSEHRLPGAPGVDEDMEGTAEDDGERVGGGAEVSKPRGKRGAGEVAQQ